MVHAFIYSAARTPLGAFQGALAALPAHRLGAVAIQGVLRKVGVNPAEVTDVLLGNVLQAGQGQAPARQAALGAGLSQGVRTATLHKVCGSGLQAVMQAHHALAAGMGSLYVAGGMESMSQAPYLLPKARDGYRIGHQQVVDSIVHDGLWDPYNNLHMGACAERCAAKYAFTREEQDAFAVESFRRAAAAQKSGASADEIVPVEFADGRGNPLSVEHDEGPARVRYDKIPTLKPAFQKDGTITPANASSLNDGAAALLVGTAGQIAQGPAIARIVSWGAHAHDPLWFTTAPVQAAQQALAAAGWSVADVDLWEINEAFAVVPMAFMRELSVPHEKVNVRGGAISLGHPIGCSGARIVVTLLSALKERGLRRGLAAICIGGGEGLAVCVERL